MTTHPTDALTVAGAPVGSSAQPPTSRSPVRGVGGTSDGHGIQPPGDAVAGSRAEGEGAGKSATPSARTWVIEVPPGTTLATSNDRNHRYKANRLNRQLKETAAQLARIQRIPRIERADVVLTYLPPPRLKKDRHPLASARVEDSGAIYPTLKAILDGLVKIAGVFADDNIRHVRSEQCIVLPETSPRGQLTLTITEVLQ